MNQSIFAFSVAAAMAGIAFSANAQTDSDKTGAADRQTASKEVVAIWSDRQQMPGYAREKQALQEGLQIATTVDWLNRLIGDRGYMVTSINEQSDNRIEYEIAKANRSYEVGVELSEPGLVANVAVSSNIYPALSTRKALADDSYRVDALIYDKETNALYRDSRYLKVWDSDKQMLRESLTPGKALPVYESQLDSMGYKITSVNDIEEDYVEYEVVKGGQTYEIQLDVLEGTRTVDNVEVDSNIWKSDATEKALAQPTD